MATVAHHIRSNYDPEADRERLEQETGQLEADAVAEACPGGVPNREEDPWLTEKPFGKSARILRPPKFVPATIDYNEWGSASRSVERVERSVQEDDESIAGWYRSLARKTPSGTPRSSTPPSTARTPPLKEGQATQTKNDTITRDRNNWFIARALETSASASTSKDNSPSSSSVPSPAPTPTLADILARDPPPLPTEEKYTPPVWLAIGPSNKGFVMLQKSGWEEGEALGKAWRKRSGLGYKDKGKEREVDVADEDAKKDVIDIDSMDKEVVDLTLSDDDEPTGVDDTFSTPPSRPPVRSSPSTQLSAETDLDHAQRALLTPLPTVLKADRLGIGLKAKTTGSGIYRAPIKRVTHSHAAIEAHVRAAEEQRRLKKLMGRGRRGFERIKKREEEGRRSLLAYLNT